MLTPKELREMVETMQPILDELNIWISKDMIRRFLRRIERGDDLTLTGTDEWQTRVYQEAGGHLEQLQRQIAMFTAQSDAEIQAIFEDAGLRAYAADVEMYRQAGQEAVPLLQSEHMLQILADTFQRTKGEVHNFTRTTAEKSQQAFISTLDTAHIRVYSGAQSYSAAVKQAVEELSDYQAEVRYPTGHTDTLEVATLRAVRTGTAQASGNMAIQGMVDHDWDIILVSAHLGARYGDGGQNPGNHFWWQGKFYSRTGKTPGLPDFVKSTGYGTGEGLSGWNCRHSFGPGDGIHNPYKEYDSDENKKEYDLSQKQRRMESAIRRSKKRLLGFGEAIQNCTNPETKQSLQDAYDQTALRLRNQNSAYHAFCSGNDRKELADRISVAKWNRSTAAKAAQRANKSNTLALEQSYSTGVGTPTANLEYINSPEYKQKFAQVSDNRELNAFVYERCKAAVTHQSGGYYEDLSIGTVTGHTLVGATSGQVPNETFYSGALKSAVAQYVRGELFSVHNHGTNLPPTGSDLASAGYRGYAFGIVACHDGRSFYYSVAKASPFTAAMYDYTVDKYCKPPYNYDMFKAMESTLNQFEKDYGIVWRELV